MSRVAVIGIGRVGLPFALVLADSGFRVTGIDIDPHLVELVNSKKAPFMEHGLERHLDRFVGDGFEATSDLEAVTEVDYVVITVGTPVDENLNPVLDELLRVVEAIAPRLRRGQTIVLRSTMSPGTTERVAKYVEAITGLKVGRDVFVAACPERIAEGRAFIELKTIPQIVGGIDSASTEAARKLFDAVGVQTLSTDALSAEITKLFTNMYRYIQFAVANEFFMIAEHYRRSYAEIRDLVNVGYPRGGLAGAGFAAGPCLFKDGFFLLDAVPYTELITNSWRINENLPNFLVRQLSSRVPLEGSRVAILGMAFKADVDDTRQSLSFRLLKLLRSQGCEVVVHDPYVPGMAEHDLGWIADHSDVVIVAVPHEPYRRALRASLTEKSVLVCDVWGVCGEQDVFFRLHGVPAERSTEVGS